ncbi:hypothetical protein [Novosphingobium sp. ST904]|uniref:hypothetical protein n=1 Tax=Novosphingobium sp. ST904 TaxID=1684385 RepID=UPI000AC8C2F3|nr:hypothetical protein [Novosphingobium sp. ST904]
MTKETNNRRFNDFAALGEALGMTPEEYRAASREEAVAEAIREDTASDAFHLAFDDVNALSILDPRGEREELEMPGPEEAQHDCRAIVMTVFDLFRDTRLEPCAQGIAWGIVNSFHYEAEKVAREEDTLSRELGEMARDPDGSEIYSAELEDLQLRAQTKMEQRAALECMRDYAAECYRAQTGHPWSAARARKCRARPRRARSPLPISSKPAPPRYAKSAIQPGRLWCFPAGRSGTISSRFTTGSTRSRRAFPR